MFGGLIFGRQYVLVIRKGYILGAYSRVFTVFAKYLLWKSNIYKNELSCTYCYLNQRCIAWVWRHAARISLDR